ncbi:MAG: hypothetical protein QM765_30570 [Myxococcales bacterium]
MADQELKSNTKCVDAFDLSQAGISFKALVFKDDAFGPFSWQVAFYRAEGDLFRLDSTAVMAGFERPTLRRRTPPQLAMQHHDLRLVWASQLGPKGLGMEEEPETIEDAVRYTAGPSIPVDKARFAREVLGDQKLADDLARQAGADAGAGGQ